MNPHGEVHAHISAFSLSLIPKPRPHMASQFHAPLPKNWGPTQTHLHQLVLVLLRDT